MTDRFNDAASRREFLTGLAATGVGATLAPGLAVGQQNAAPAPTHHGVVDTHHHFWAPEYLKAQTDYEEAHQHPGYPVHYAAMLKWTPEVSLAEMDRGGVQTAMLSLASISDGFWGLDAQSADRVVRASIDYAKKMMSDHPGRFGLFAPLSMIDVPSSLKQIEYALDQAKADGIGINTSYHDTLPGDPSFNPLWEELNRRGAIVYLHGPNPACCSEQAFKSGPGMNPSVVEVTFDMARAAVSLLVNGTFAKYGNIRWVLSYGGGVLPFVAGRVSGFVNGSMRFQGGKQPQEIAPQGVIETFQKLYYDTVNVTEPTPWKALTDFVPTSQIVYGTDYLYFNNDQLANIDKRVSDPKEKELILSGNAKKLIPRLAKV